jgi:cytochrome c-type protein NapB
MPERGPDSAQRRVMALLAAAVVAVAFIGIVTGISPEEYQAKRPKPRIVADPGDVPPARTHAELERRPWGGNPETSGWSRSKGIARVAASEEAPEGAVELDDSVREAVADRALLRAYDGAPPVIPHPVRAGGAPGCLACHGDGFALAGRRASALPHQAFASCTQCHVSSMPSPAVAKSTGPVVAANSWVGLASPTSGATAYDGAPPAVPHATWMREECESCHGPDASAPLRTPHPERRSCLQCHPAISERGPLGAR